MAGTAGPRPASDHGWNDALPRALVGSALVLVVYAAANAAHVRLAKRTGCPAWIPWISLAGCAAAFVLLCRYVYARNHAGGYAIAALVAGSFAVEWLYRSLAHRAFPAGGD